MRVTSTGTPPTRRRMAAADRRAGILNAARTVFAERGYHGATTAEIARAAECSEAALYRHFDSKLELLSAVMEDVQTSRLAELAVTRTFGDTIRSLQSPEAVEAGRIMLDALTIDDSGVRSILLTAFGRARSGIGAAVQAAQAAGELDPELDPEDITWMIQGLGIVGLIRRSIQPDDVAEGAVRAADILTERLRKRPESA